MRSKNQIKEIERIFQISNSTDELFDSFRIAVDKKIKDADLYKILLWNKTLSKDEICMYAEKVCKEFPEFGMEIYLTAAEVLDSTSLISGDKELSFQYIKKATEANKKSFEPYVHSSRIYNQELDIPTFENIVYFIKNGLNYVQKKSKLYFLLSQLYARKGEIETGRSFYLKGEEAKENEK